MKNLKLGISALALTVASTVFAQTTSNPWLIGVGAHAENHMAVNEYSFGKTLTNFKEVFNINNYSITPPLSKLTVARNINKWLVLDWQTTVGNVDNKRFNYSKQFFLQTGLGLELKLNGLWNEDSWFDPYVRVGGNYLRHDYKGLTFPRTDANGVGYSAYDGNGLLYGKWNHFTASGGLGSNFWLTKSFGLNIQGDYVTTPTNKSDVPNFWQASASLLFRFGQTDRDHDGVLDKNDKCPDVAGPVENQGCPWPDTDGDGILDKDDKCPDVAGPAENQGCPWPDTDGDGVLDKDDACPTVAGPASNKGCPEPDTDGDGVLDKDDHCPTVAGPASNHGCPDVTETVTNTFKMVFFNFNKATIRPEAAVKLDEAAKYLNGTEGNYLVEGFTDIKGSAAYNLNLSRNRAKAVVDALVAKGVNAARLKSAGYGAQFAKQPATASNDARESDRKVTAKLVSGSEWDALPVSDLATKTVKAVKKAVKMKK